MASLLFSKNCYFCGHRLAIYYRYRWCPHIAFCKKQHRPRTTPWCDFCEQDRPTPSSPTEHLRLTCDPMTPVTPPKPLVFPYALVRPPHTMGNRRSTAKIPQKLMRQMVTPALRCYTCGAKLTEPEAYRLCPHIVFCTASCTPSGQPMCYEC